MFGHLGVAGTTLVTLLWGGTPWQDALSSPPLTFRMEGTVAFRPEDTPKDQFVVFGAGHEIQDTLDIPQPPPGGRLLLVLDAIPVLGEDGLPVDNWTRPARVVARPLWRIGTDSSDDRLRRGTLRPGHHRAHPGPWPGCRLKAALAGYPKVPTWSLRVQLVTEQEGAGHRNPDFCQPLWLEEVMRPGSSVAQTITIPEGVRAPRIILRSTGHSATGSAYHEFVSLTHVVRVDGQEVARFRPWREDGGTTRRLNPSAGRPDPSNPGLLASIWTVQAGSPDRKWSPGSSPCPN